MLVNELLDTEVGANLTVSTETFTLNSQLPIHLEGGVQNRWFFSEEGLFLSVNPETEEMLLFTPVDTELERDDDIIVEGGKDYELSYEDRGTVQDTDGDGPYSADDELEFCDFEADDGTRIRIVTNTFNGEEDAYVGRVVIEEDIISNE